MQLPTDLPPVCRLLRSKGAPGVTYDEFVSWEAGDVSTATFWCLATAEPVGPDDGFVHAHACVEGRACFEPPRDADPPESSSPVP